MNNKAETAGFLFFLLVVLVGLSVVAVQQLNRQARIDKIRLERPGYCPECGRHDRP